jgi:hypothetical protein
MSFGLTNADLSSDSNESFIYMDAEMDHQQNQQQQQRQQVPQQLQVPNPIDGLIALRAVSSINDKQYVRLTSILYGSGTHVTTDDIEDYCIQARLASLT